MVIERDLFACMWGEIPYTETNGQQNGQFGPSHVFLLILFN